MGGISFLDLFIETFHFLGVPEWNAERERYLLTGKSLSCKGLAFPLGTLRLLADATPIFGAHAVSLWGSARRLFADATPRDPWQLRSNCKKEVDRKLLYS